MKLDNFQSKAGYGVYPAGQFTPIKYDYPVPLRGIYPDSKSLPRTPTGYLPRLKIFTPYPYANKNFIFCKGRPKLCLWVTTVEHCRFRNLFNVFQSFTTNHRRQRCAFVISLEMKTATMQHYSSGKWLYCSHDVFQTRFNDFNVDLKLIN